jgi:hypothetical protein
VKGFRRISSDWLIPIQYLSFFQFPSTKHFQTAHSFSICLFVFFSNPKFPLYPLYLLLFFSVYYLFPFILFLSLFPTFHQYFNQFCFLPVLALLVCVSIFSFNESCSLFYSSTISPLLFLLLFLVLWRGFKMKGVKNPSGHNLAVARRLYQKNVFWAFTPVWPCGLEVFLDYVKIWVSVVALDALKYHPTMYLP